MNIEEARIWMDASDVARRLESIISRTKRDENETAQLRSVLSDRVVKLLEEETKSISLKIDIKNVIDPERKSARDKYDNSYEHSRRRWEISRGTDDLIHASQMYEIRTSAENFLTFVRESDDGRVFAGPDLVSWILQHEQPFNFKQRIERRIAKVNDEIDGLVKTQEDLQKELEIARQTAQQDRYDEISKQIPKSDAQWIASIASLIFMIAVAVALLKYFS